MKDRLIGMMGTLGLVLVLTSLMPPASAFAFGGSGGGGTSCGGAGCATVGIGGDLGCAQVQPVNACTGKDCGCVSGRNPFTAQGSCRCLHLLKT
jgi:hypothetical protein